jgi:4-aminobutyrate aminotransferase-like enzyme
LRELQQRHTVIHEVRGMGLMIGVELRDAGGNPAAALLDILFEELKDAGYLLGKTGPGRNVLTLMPPLVVERDDLDSLVVALDHALAFAA